MGGSRTPEWFELAKHAWLRGVSIDWDRVENRDVYPFNIPALAHIEDLELDLRCTFLVGENGSGKSTLLEAIAVQWGFNPEGGTINFNFATRESHSELSRALLLDKGPSGRRAKGGFFLRAESFFNVATEIEKLGVGGYGDKSLHEQSHGESFLALVEHRCVSPGLYLFDEPEAALSPQRQLTLLGHMHRLIRNGAQLIIATHSPILLGYPDATILQFSAEGVEPVAYEDTEHFRVTRDFLTRRERMLKTLFEDDDVVE